MPCRACLRAIALVSVATMARGRLLVASNADAAHSARGPASYAGDPPLLFSEESCSAMGATKLKLGGPVPPAEVVPGCTEVCDMIKSMKEYWMTGGMATFACEEAAKYGCVWGSGADIQSPSDIAC